MIDWEITKTETGIGKDYFDEFPKSNKKVLAVCDNCSKKRWVDYPAYRDLCKSCVKKDFYFTDEHRKNISKAKMGQGHSEETCEKISTTKLKQYSKMDDPGQEIVTHHYIYDFNDWNKYTIKITRSEHLTIHNNLRHIGLEIPCINIMMDD